MPFWNNIPRSYFQIVWIDSQIENNFSEFNVDHSHVLCLHFNKRLLMAMIKSKWMDRNAKHEEKLTFPEVIELSKWLSLQQVKSGIQQFKPPKPLVLLALNLVRHGKAKKPLPQSLNGCVFHVPCKADTILPYSHLGIHRPVSCPKCRAGFSLSSITNP